MGARRAIVLVLVLSQFAVGCASHLDVIRSPHPDPGEIRGSIAIEAHPDVGPPVDGVRFRIYDEEDDLLGEFKTFSDRPFRIDSLPPGEYRVVMFADDIGDRMMEKQFDLHAGESILVRYDDRRDDNARTGRAVLKGLEVTGYVLLVATVVAADVALVALSCGCWRPCLYRAVCR